MDRSKLLNSRPGERGNENDQKETKNFISEDIINYLADNLERWQIICLSRNLGLREKEIDKIRVVNLLKNTKEGISQMLKTWKEFSSNLCTEHHLFEALTSIQQEELARKLFPGIDQKSPKIDSKNSTTVISKTVIKNDTGNRIISHLANTIREDDAYVLFKKLGIQDSTVDDVMNRPWLIGFPKKFCTLLQQWRSNYKNDDEWKIDLMSILCSIDRFNVVKEIFPNLMTRHTGLEEKLNEASKISLPEDVDTRKITIDEASQPSLTRESQSQSSSTDSEQEFFSQLVNKIGKDEGPFLFSNLKEITDEEIKTEMDQHGNWQDKYCKLLQKWKVKMQPLDWKFELVQALVAVARMDVIEEFFPEYIKHSSERKPIQKEKDNQAVSSLVIKEKSEANLVTSPKLVIETEQEPLSQLIRKIGEDQGPFLFSNLKEITDEEVRRTIDQPGEWEIKYYNLLHNWKEKISHLDWKFELVQALVAISRMDVIEDFFPEYLIHPSEKRPIQNEKDYLTESSRNEGKPLDRKSFPDEIDGEKNFDKYSHHNDVSTLTDKTLREDYENNAVDEFESLDKLLKEEKEDKSPSERESDSEEENSFSSSPIEDQLRNIQDYLKDSYLCFRMPKTIWSKNLKVGIKEVYVPLDFLHKSYDDSEEIELEDLFSKKREEDTNRILVESPPGFGKTMLCHKIAYDWSNNEAYLQIFAVVFVLFLRHFTGNLEEMLIDECSVKSRSKDKILELITKLEDRILLILDGFDELTEKGKENLVPLLTGEKYPKMTVLVTSRMGCFQPFCTERRDSVQVGFSMRNQQNLENMNFWQSIIEIKGVSKVNSELLLKNYFGKDAEMYLGMISLMLSEDLKTFEKSPFVLLLTTIIIQVKGHKSITSLTEIFKYILKIAFKGRLVEDSNFDKKTKLTLFASNNGDPLFQVMVKFGKFAFRMLSTDTFTYKEDDLIKKVDKKFFLSLGILMENVILSDGKKINVLEPVNKLFMEFFAAFYFSTSLTDYYEGSGRMKNSLITLMSNFIINRKHLLFLPFVGGFLKEKLCSFLELLSPCSSILSPFDFPIFGMIVESQCINKLLPSIQSFIPPVYNYASSQTNNRYKEITKKTLIQDGINRNQIKVMHLNFFGLEDLPKISGAKIVTLSLEELSVEERPVYHKSRPKNLNISCNNLVILWGNIQIDNWDDYVQVVRSVKAKKLHICFEPGFSFNNLSNCLMRLHDEKDMWKKYNSCSLNLSVNVSIEQKDILKCFQRFADEELNLEQIHLNLICNSTSLENMLLGLQMNVENSINFLLCLNNSLDVLEDQVFMCMQEAAEFLLMCLEDCFRELKCFDHQLKENFQDDSVISELQSFIADKLQEKFINFHKGIIDIIESVKRDVHSFFRNHCEMAQVFVFLRRHVDSILSELSKLIDEIKSKHSNLKALLNVLDNREESVKNLNEELQQFCITLSNSSIDYLSISNSKQSKLFPLHMDLLCQCGKKKWKRIHVRNNIKLEFNETRFPKFHISNLELDGDRVVFATNDVRTILQCESLDSLVCSSLALEMLLRQPIERDWNGFETLQRIRINMNETRFSQLGFSSLKPFRKLKHLTLNFESVSCDLNYQKHFVDAISLHSLKILELQNAVCEFSFLRDFMKELIETHSQKESQNYRPLLYLEELKIDFPHLREDISLKELFILVDKLFKTNIIEIFTFVTSESNVCKFIQSEVLARDNWKMKKDICIEDDRLCEVSELYWQSKDIPQVFSITKG